MLAYGPNKIHTILTGPYMSTIRRDKSPKGAGKSPIFSVRLTPEFKEQLDSAAARAGVSLGNWLKELAREELRRQGEEPKG
ncbi:toxin-antitoxin system HicB family antitoxin [Klebsiella pneumoniae]